MAMGMLVFMVDFTPLTSHGLPFSLSFLILSYKKIELLIFGLKNAFFQTEKKCVIFFPSIDLRGVLLK